MTITQAEAMESARARLDEPSSVYWSEKDLRRWINEVARDIARRTESLRGTFDLTAVVGQFAYTPTFAATTQPYRVMGVEFTPTGQTQVYTLEYRDRNVATDIWGLAQQQIQGIPAIWTSWGAPPSLNLQFFPSPSQAGTFTLYYYRLPETLAIIDTSDQNSTVDLVEGWEDVLVDGVEYKAKRRDNDPSWTEAKQEYEQHLEAEMESTLRYTDAAGAIAWGSSGYMPQWLYGGEELYG